MVLTASRSPSTSVALLAGRTVLHTGFAGVQDDKLKRGDGLFPFQMHVGVVLVEADLQRLFMAADEFSGDGAGEVGGLVGGAGSQAESVLAGGNFQSFRLYAAHAVEYHQVLLRSAVQGTRQS